MIQKLNTLIVLFKAHQSIQNNVKLSLVDTELTLNEFTVMGALYTKKELSTQQLIDSVLIPNSSMTYVLDILEKRQYLRRLKDPSDKRRQLLSLTQKGCLVFLDIYQKHYEHMNTIFNVLTPEETQQLSTLLKKVGKKAEETLTHEMY